MTAGCYVTGTDTGIGKTRVSVALLHALRGQGSRAVGMKPVASGCEPIDGQWRNDDALSLQSASDLRPAYADINPFALPAATAPQLAARDAGIAVDIETILAAYGRLSAMGDMVVVEGVGGWAAPLSDTLDQAQLVRRLDIPVVMVAGLRLGCLSHARLTARAVQQDGCRLAGWIANGIDRDFDRADDYMELLRASLEAPCLGRLAYAPYAAPDMLARAIDIASLIR